MSIAQQLARNRAAFAALVNPEQSVRPSPSPEAAEDWRLAANAPSHRAAPPPKPVPTPIVQPSRETVRPLTPLPANRDAPSPLPPTAPVYSLERPPALRGWELAGHTVSPPAPESEIIPAVTDVRFPEPSAQAPAPAPEAPLQALLRQLETDARRGPQLHNEEDCL